MNQSRAGRATCFNRPGFLEQVRRARNDLEPGLAKFLRGLTVEPDDDGVALSDDQQGGGCPALGWCASARSGRPPRETPGELFQGPAQCQPD
jgi:hypothetical protein